MGSSSLSIIFPQRSVFKNAIRLCRLSAKRIEWQRQRDYGDFSIRQKKTACIRRLRWWFPLGRIVCGHNRCDGLHQRSHAEFIMFPSHLNNKKESTFHHLILRTSFCGLTRVKSSERIKYAALNIANFSLWCARTDYIQFVETHTQPRPIIKKSRMKRDLSSLNARDSHFYFIGKII